MRANLLADLPDAMAAEVFTTVLARPGCRVERIVSHGQITPAGQPYCGVGDEWVLLLDGGAHISLDGAEIVLAPGDHLLIPAGVPHRVTFTMPDRPTVWLAIHFAEADPESSLPSAVDGPG